MREGLHGLIGKLRLPGTALIVEDVCVPPERIAEGARDLQALLGEHGFLPGVAGHASAGNLHFMLTPDFAKAGGPRALRVLHERPGRADRRQVRRLAQGRARDRDQHGPLCGARVGRAGDRADVADQAARRPRRRARARRRPQPRRRRPPAQPEDDAGDRGVRDLLRGVRLLRAGLPEPQPDDDAAPADRPAPRDRPPARRLAAARALQDEFAYEALDTCAADGSCQIACPVGIDTGALVKELRQERHSERAEKSALRKARRWGLIEGASRVGLRFGGPLARLTKRGRAFPAPASAKLPATLHTGAAAVYVPSCTTGSSPARPVEALVEVSARAGLPVWIPDDVAGSCCGLPWSSKGYDEAHRHKANEMVERLWAWSGEGALPIVIDAASCTHGDRRTRRRRAQRGERRAPRQARDPRLGRLGARPPAALARGRPRRSARPPSTRPARPAAWAWRRGCEALADALAEDVYVAPSATCCGFAGDRGISHPELTASATRPQVEELAGRHFDAHLSSNRTCEIGLTRATGEPYESVLILLERLLEPRSVQQNSRSRLAAADAARRERPQSAK